jgi:hypothetical protein
VCDPLLLYLFINPYTPTCSLAFSLDFLQSSLSFRTYSRRVSLQGATGPFQFAEVSLIRDNQGREFKGNSLIIKGLDNQVMKTLIITDNQGFHHVSPKFFNSPDDSPDQTLNRIKIYYHLTLVPGAPPSDQPSNRSKKLINFCCSMRKTQRKNTRGRWQWCQGRRTYWTVTVSRRSSNMGHRRTVRVTKKSSTPVASKPLGRVQLTKTRQPRIGIWLKGKKTMLCTQPRHTLTRCGMHFRNTQMGQYNGFRSRLSGKQHDTLKKRTMDKTLENTLKTSINITLPTCDDKW